MDTINTIEMVILVGVWLALNLSMIRDWLLQRNPGEA